MVQKGLKDLGLTINADNLCTDMESDYANPKYIGWGGNRSEDPQEVMERIQVLKSVQVMMMLMMMMMTMTLAMMMMTAMVTLRMTMASSYHNQYELYHYQFWQVII